MLNVVLIAGSSRVNSQSAKVAGFLRQRLIELDLTSEGQSSIIDLGEKPLPMWPQSENSPWAEYQQQLTAADAVVVIAPEWHGMAGPALKNFFLFAGKTELAHKPGLLVGISSGIGGAYPISELRASGYKNCRVCYLPEHLIIRHVDKVLNGAEVVSEDDQRIRARIDYALDVFGKYAVALKPVRAAIDMESYATGM